MKRTTLLDTPFFISKKVQVEAPEPEPGGNAWNFIKIFNYGKLKIGLRRDFRDFAIFLIHFRFLQGSNPRPIDSKPNALSIRPRRQQSQPENF